MNPALTGLLKIPYLDVFVDATFDCTPNPFSQCLIFMIYDHSTSSYMPILYALMTSKCKEAYWHVFNRIYAIWVGLLYWLGCWTMAQTLFFSGSYRHPTVIGHGNPTIAKRQDSQNCLLLHQVAKYVYLATYLIIYNVYKAKFNWVAIYVCASLSLCPIPNSCLLPPCSCSV